MSVVRTHHHLQYYFCNLKPKQKHIVDAVRNVPEYKEYDDGLQTFVMTSESEPHGL